MSVSVSVLFSVRVNEFDKATSGVLGLKPSIYVFYQTNKQTYAHALFKG